MSVSFLAENKTMQTIRARVAFHSRQHGFDKCMQQITNSTQPINAAQIADLYAFWGDPLSAADEQFLRSCLAEVEMANGPIMLAGASLMTLILGALCDRDPAKAKQIWCLENDRHWANLIRSWLTEYRVNGAHVIQSQARLFDDSAWYAVDTGRLAKSYRLIICDGGRSTPKGAIGAIRRLGDRFDSRFTLLARNVKDTAVLRELNGWAKDNDATFALIDKQEGFIKLTRQVASSSEGAPVARMPAASPKPRPPQKKAALPAAGRKRQNA